MKIINLFISLVALSFMVSCEKGYDLVIPETMSLESVTRYEVFQPPTCNDTVAVLVFGNSFSYDALYYLPSIAHSRGKGIILGNLVLGGCSLKRHWNNVNRKFAGYDYFKDTGMKHEYLTNYPVEAAYDEEDWDMVVFQECALTSGDYSAYVPYVFQLQEAMKEILPERVEYVWHQTWAFPENSDYDSFEAYKYSQAYMYECIVAASWRVADELGSRCFLPSGTAIQLMRREIGDFLCRDNRHLNDLGRYTAACVWYEVLFGDSAEKIDYFPSSITENDAKKARCAAHLAVMSPFELHSN